MFGIVIRMLSLEYNLSIDLLYTIFFKVFQLQILKDTYVQSSSTPTDYLRWVKPGIKDLPSEKDKYFNCRL